MSAKNEWTPYGLEAIRIRYLRRRRILALFIALGLAGLWAFMFDTTTTTQTDIFVNGQRANTINIDLPEEQETGPVTVSLEPGRVTTATSGGPQTEQNLQRTGAPVYERAPPVPYQLYVLLYGPYVLLAAALWFLAKKRGKHDEVNYGIYKGAMPLEMLSAGMADRVVTTKWAKTSLFGKRRGDYLPPEVLRANGSNDEEA